MICSKQLCKKLALEAFVCLVLFCGGLKCAEQNVEIQAAYITEKTDLNKTAYYEPADKQKFHELYDLFSQTDYCTSSEAIDTKNCLLHPDDLSSDMCKPLGKQWDAKKITFKDQSTPITMCTCVGSSPWNTSTLAKYYSAVPAFLRKNVKSVAMLGTDAKTPENHNLGVHVTHHIQYYAPKTFETKHLHTLFHESSHSHDKYQGPDGKEINFSEQKAYKEAIDKDTCVPTNYSKTNYKENYAESMSLYLYKLMSPNDKQYPTCMKNVMQVIGEHPDVKQFARDHQKASLAIARKVLGLV